MLGPLDTMPTSVASDVASIAQIVSVCVWVNTALVITWLWCDDADKRWSLVASRVIENGAPRALAQQQDKMNVSA